MQTRGPPPVTVTAFSKTAVPVFLTGSGGEHFVGETVSVNVQVAEQTFEPRSKTASLPVPEKEFPCESVASQPTDGGRSRGSVPRSSSGQQSVPPNQ